MSKVKGATPWNDLLSAWKRLVSRYGEGACHHRESWFQLRGVPECACLYGGDPLALCMAGNSQASGAL